MKTKKAECPNCKSTNTCRIQYGLPIPTEKLERELQSGKVYLGGCDISGDDPDRHCNDCDIDFVTVSRN